MNQPIVGKGKEQKDNEEYSRNFARIPNMLFSSFKHLSKEEKYLYCTLKCVYWDGRGRYVSLRELSDLTGYSVGALSKTLPRLHTCGLVSAEVRRQLDKDGHEKGNPKYLISILDIWELNRYYHSCSPNERDLLDPSLKLVHENTQACSPNDTNLFTKSDKLVSFGEQVHAQVEHAKERKDLIKTFGKKESGKPSVTSKSLVPQPNPLSLSQKKSLSGETLVSHPVHSFVWFDDLVNPSVMVVRLTNAFPHPHHSEMEDKRRERIAAWEVLPTLKKEGLEVEVRWEHETEQTHVVVEAQTTKPTHPKIALTDQEADFWTRWCAIAGTQTFNETAHKHVVVLASKITTTESLQSLYDYAYDRLRELASTTTGKEAVPPRLGNLVKCLPEWEQAQNRKRAEKDQDQAAHEHIPGTGKLTNWTQARIDGKEPPINYDPLPTVKPAGSSGLSQVGNISAGLQERIRQARERRKGDS